MHSRNFPDEPPTCRLCWAEADGGGGGELLAPCACKGSLAAIHARCLAAWQRELVRQGRGWRAARCELCNAEYTGLPPDWWSAASGGAAVAALPQRPRGAPICALPAALMSGARGLAADAACVRRWPALALRLWKGHLLLCAVVRGPGGLPRLP
jgi:hypothetical protein